MLELANPIDASGTLSALRLLAAADHPRELRAPASNATKLYCRTEARAAKACADIYEQREFGLLKYLAIPCGDAMRRRKIRMLFILR